jgi:ATP-binding cassette subfamily B protein
LYLADLFEFLDLEIQVRDAAEPVAISTELRRGVTFEGVQFCYPGLAKPVLADFHLHIRAGQLVAIVGRNGAGKSTLVKLLCRQYDVHSGRILIDGVDVRDVLQADLRRMITVLFQEPVHYNDTLAGNIALGELDRASRNHIETAGRNAGMERLVSTLPRGYDTLLGKWFEGGTDLSVGEWQRVALARAFLRSASIVILDEPTSAMDPWSEAEWLQRFREYSAGKTSLLITHRFTTARYADEIHVMDYGSIVESGTHEELLATNGLYADSWYARSY